jgi:outer membrane protein OmpA-like peptidoglycan-associated protein
MRVNTVLNGTLLLVASGLVTLARAQERGTIELGAYGAVGFYDEKATALKTGYGGGLRFGAFLDPRFAVEFDVNQLSAARTVSGTSVSVRSIAAHLNYTFLEAAPLSLVLGGGGGGMIAHDAVRSYMVGALLGAKFAIADNVALRVDGLANWMTSTNWAPAPSVQVGLSFFRHPNHVVQTVVAQAPMPAPARVRVDTVYRVRVDSVLRMRTDSVKIAVAGPDQLVLRVQFQTNKATLLPRSRPVLDTIAKAIIATPGSQWEVQGHADSVGTNAINKPLAQARAQSVVDYLVSKGVKRTDLTATGFGPERPVFSNATEYGRAQNRRVQLRRIPPPPTGEPIK